MKQKIKLGVVCLVRNTFDYNAAGDIYRSIIDDLKQLENVELFAFKETIMEPHEAAQAGRYFASSLVDAIAVISGTFHLGHLVLEIKKICDQPLLLWALPELPYDGGKIRLNSLCGVNLNASNLTKGGYTDFTYQVAHTIDENWVDAVRMIAALKQSRLGLLGYRAHGFFNVAVNELALYEKFGCLVDHYELSDLFACEEKSEQTAYYTAKIKEIFNTDGLAEAQVQQVARLASKMKNFMADTGVRVLAVRCWPEFARDFGIAPCAAMSLLQEEDLLLACEGDLDCGITMLCHQAAGAKTPFMADLSQVNIEENFALMWHCGVAPCGLRDGACTPTLDTYFAGGKGITAGFVLKEGPIHMARLDSINGKYRLFQEKGSAVSMEKQLTGTYARCKFEHTMQDVLDKVIYSGIAHHFSMAYGDFAQAFSLFARLKNIEVL